MIFTTYDLFGWAGVLFIVLSFTFFSRKKLRVDYTLYHLLNLLGFMGLIVSTFATESWPALALSLIFAAISIVYIVKILTTKHPYKEFRLE